MHRAVLNPGSPVSMSRVDFAEIKAQAESLIRELGLGGDYDCQALTAEHEYFGTFIPGRGAAIGKGGSDWLVFGELSPQVLENFGLGYPAAVLEMDLEVLLG